MAGRVALGADKKAEVSPEERMKRIEAACKPGPAHKALGALVGDWSTEIKMWSEPGAEPMVSKGTAKVEWVLNGKFVREEFQGEVMGQPFRGMSFTGYDNAKEKFTNVWMDDMNTAMFTSEGESDSGYKVITFGGSYHCPITNEPNKKFKQVVRILSPQKRVYEMYDLSQGPNVKTMEITYTKKR